MDVVERRLERDGYYSITVTDVHSKEVIISITGNNGSQTKAILSAMNRRLSLIQGPPG